MKVTQKKLDDGRLLIDAVASTAEVSNALNNAHLAFAQQMGMRPEKDKTVAQAAEERMGIKDLDSVVMNQAVEALVPFAIDKVGVIPAFPPQPEPKTALKRGQTFQFGLHLTPKPDYELTSYEPVSITIQEVSIDERQVDEQINQVAERYAEFVADDPHPVRKGDSCLLAMESYENGEKLPGLTTDARTYSAGAGLMPDGFDENIIGMDVGETKTFTFEGPGIDDEGNEIVETIECTVTVKEIQKKVAPVIDDAWVAKFMPMYKDVAAMRDDIRRGLNRQLSGEYENYKRNMAAGELAKRFQGSIADEVYESMSRNLMNNMRAEVEQQNMTWDQFVEQQGGEQQFNMMMMMQTRQMLVQGYALDALFRHEGLVVSDEDVQEACAAMNPQNPQGVRRQMEESGRGFALREAAERTIPKDWAQKEKLGFPVPMVDWLRQDRYYNQVKEWFTGDIAQQFFNTDELVRLLDEHRYKIDRSRKIWIVYMFLMWYKIYFVDKTVPKKPAA